MSETNLTYIFAKEKGSQLISFWNDDTTNLYSPEVNFTYFNLRSIYESNILACDVSRFDIFETSEQQPLGSPWANTSIELWNKTIPSYTSLEVDTTFGFRS